jgi:hypothetical protein
MNKMKKLPKIIIVLLFPFLSFGQNLIKIDSVQMISEFLKKEYIPFEKITFNNGKIKFGMEWKVIIKNIKLYPIKKEICEDDTCWQTTIYYTSTKKTTNIWSEGRAEIKDNTLRFDFYKELFIGAPVQNIKKYFPNRYKYIFGKYSSQYIKEKRFTYLLVLPVESRQGYYPDNMGFLTMGIEIDLKTMKIKSFEFFDQDQ